MTRKCNGNVTGAALATLVGRAIIPTVEELLQRWERLYPVVRNRRPVRWMACVVCGHRATRQRLQGMDCQQRVLRGRHGGPPERDSEDEYVTICPDCGARESFGEAADET